MPKKIQIGADGDSYKALLPEEEREPKKHGIIARHVPILQWLPEYQMEWLSMDVVCGVTLGLMCVAQTLAQAMIAGVKPIAGPYTAFVPPIVYAFLGTSRHCSVSSGSMGAILIASVLDPNLSLEAKTELAALLALVAGLFQILMGMCNLAFAVRFLSQATISGFTSGAAILIMASQVKSLCGFATPPPANCALAKIGVAFTHWREINPTALALCVFLLVLLDACKKFKAFAKSKSKSDPSRACLWTSMCKIAEMKEVIVMIAGASFAYAMMPAHAASLDPEKHAAASVVPILGHMPSGLPEFHSPFGQAAMELWEGPTAKLQSFIISGILIAFTAFLTTYASNKRLAMAYQYELDASQELFALGTACAAGSFFGAFPVCGSLSRTALAGQIGSKTQVCGLVVAGIVALSLAFLAPILFYLPKCALAAIVITSAVSLFDFQTPQEIWHSSQATFKGALHKDFTVWCIGFACTVQLGALYGIGIAVTVGLCQVLAEATTPKTAKLGAVEELGGSFRDVESYPNAETFSDKGLLIFEVRGPLCFCSAEGFHEELMARMSKDVKGVVLCFGAVEYIDYSALSVLKDVLVHFKHDHIKCKIADVKPNVELVLKEKLGGGEGDKKFFDFDYISIEEAVTLLEDEVCNNADADSSMKKLAHLRFEEAAHFHDIHHTHLGH